jgi:hypothetical protein
MPIVVGACKWVGNEELMLLLATGLDITRYPVARCRKRGLELPVPGVGKSKSLGTEESQ